MRHDIFLYVVLPRPFLACLALVLPYYNHSKLVQTGQLTVNSGFDSAMPRPCCYLKEAAAAKKKEEEAAALAASGKQDRSGKKAGSWGGLPGIGGR